MTHRRCQLDGDDEKTHPGRRHNNNKKNSNSSSRRRRSSKRPTTHCLTIKKNRKHSPTAHRRLQLLPDQNETGELPVVTSPTSFPATTTRRTPPREALEGREAGVGDTTRRPLKE